MTDRLTLYTVISAFWMAFLAILGVNIVGGIVMPKGEGALEEFAYPIEAAEEEATAESGGGGQERESALPLLAAADPDKGAGVFRKCQTCHTVEQGGKNGTGPNLYNIIGAEIGDHNGFKVSDSLKAIGGVWTYEKLEDYIENPKRLAPRGTMSFVGLKKAKERADVLAYMRQFNDNPPPYPVIEEQTAEEPAAPDSAAEMPAEGEAAPADGEMGGGEAAPAEGEMPAAVPAEAEVPAEATQPE